jgi:sortase A
VQRELCTFYGLLGEREAEMRTIIAGLLLLVGLVLIGSSVWEITDVVKEQDKAMEEATKTIKETKEKVSRDTFQPLENQTIGILRIPKIDAQLPIVEGTSPEDLKKGVGHYKTTGFPGDGKQILLSGHRDTVFRKFGELKKGDEFIVELPYGTFRYKMDTARIVPADDTSVIGSVQDEVLNLSTCYPFRFIGSAPDRYIIYAYPSEKQS